MKISLKVVACMAALAVLMVVQSASAQNKLEGVWKMTEVTFTGPNARTITGTQPGFLIITKKHFSMVGVQGDKPQPDLPQQGATDAQKVAAWTPFLAVGELSASVHRRQECRRVRGLCGGFILSPFLPSSAVKA